MEKIARKMYPRVQERGRGWDERRRHCILYYSCIAQPGAIAIYLALGMDKTSVQDVCPSFGTCIKSRKVHRASIWVVL